MVESIFGSEKVISEHISNTDLKVYYVDFDLNDEGKMDYRIDELVDVLKNVLVEFAFGLHEGDTTKNSEVADKLSDAARAIYKIDEFKEAKRKYIDDDSEYPDDMPIEEKFLKRGEFGELILHLILRDFCKTIPLISKIYFKDSFNCTVHGFDAVHICPETKSLWLGESKLYLDPKRGIAQLVEDIKCHIKKDYLKEEFNIISKKIKGFGNIPEKKVWVDLMSKNIKLETIISNINIPLICTYSSKNFKSSSEEKKQFIENLNKEVEELKKYFDEKNKHPLKSKLNLILILFPIRCKNELIKKMHQKLDLMQQL
jgi:hypothetical protein